MFQSYVPYTNCPSGISIIIKSKIYSGGSIENCAFNPGLPPLQCALISAVIDNVKSYEDVRIN